MSTERNSRFLLPAASGFVLLLGLVFVRLYLHGGNERLCLLVLLLKAAGLFASFILVLGTLEAPFFKRFCPHGWRFDCKRVIDSPAGTLFGFIHLADLGVLYFASSLMLLVFTSFSPDFYYYVVFLGLLNLLTLPYTFFSVLYQAFAVRRWCALCLIVQLIFWLEFWQFFPFLFGNPVVFEFNLELLYPVIISFGIPLFFWPLLRYLLVMAYEKR